MSSIRRFVTPCLFAFAACSANEGGDAIRTSGGGESGSGNGTGTPTGSGGTGAGGSGIIIGSGGTGPGTSGDGGPGKGGSGNGTPEVCDGIDNDGNGIIDDVDVGKDGVCDCLNIATIGQIGPWSNGGNVFASWLNARSPMGAVALDDQVLTADLLRPFQIIVSLHVGTMVVAGNNRMAAAHHPFSDAEANAFQTWVESGGGAMTTIGYFGNEAEEVVNVNRLLATVGMAYSTTALGLDGFVTTWNPHAVTMGISSINTANGVEPAGGGTTLAVGSANRLALKVTQQGKGRVVVWGDEWITYDSEWRDVANQQVELFWLNILKWLSPPNRCQVPIPPIIK